MKHLALLCLLLLHLVTKAQVNLSQGLVTYFPFSGNTNDLSGNNINGTGNNVTLTTDRDGIPNSAYYFNGNDAFIGLPFSSAYDFTPQDSFTIVVRILPDPGNSWPAQALFVKSPFEPDFNLSQWNYGSYALSYRAMSGFAASNILVGTTLFTNDPCWYTIITTYKNGIWRLYVNGVLEDSDLSQTNFILQDGPASKIAIGRKGDSDGDYFKGKMDEVRLYHRVINQDEINALSSCAPAVTSTSFTAPDTVCVNSPVQVTNTSTGTSSYYWTFCESQFSNTPNAVNLGNPGGQLSWPVFTDLVEDNGNYYGFVVNNFPSGITRLDYGNSYLNVPTVTFLGNLGGTLPGNAEGIQIVKSNGNWIGVLVGGSPSAGNASQLVTFNFGPNITNPTPASTNWGNVGNLLYPIDLFVFTENNNWYGYTVNADNNTLTRFSFGSDFSQPPTGVNLGNIGGLDQPVGIGQVKEGNNWHIFITNEGPTNALTRLDFGPSLLGIPTGVNLGNPNGVFNKARDISFINLCDGISALSVNGGTYTVTKLNFPTGLTNPPVASNLGNLGNLNFPHSISELFRVGNDIYAFVPNVFNYTLTRLQIPGTCTAMAASTLQSPAPIIYTQPGTYNIHLMTDIGLPTQGSFCKQIVVRSCTQGISNIINDYTPVISLNACDNSINVEDGAAYNIGDTVLLIQMKGAVINTTNSAAFGTVTDYKNAGNYEFNYVAARTGNVITLKNRMIRQYDVPAGKVQLIRVPYYRSTDITGTLTCLPWDGSKGGVLVLNARDSVRLQADIDVSGRGFRGGVGFNSANPALSCNENDFTYPSTSQVQAALKGESISDVAAAVSRGKGAPAGGGGGGLGHNSGGGGGGNAGTGGLGGYQLDNCGGFPFDNRGIGGHSIPYSSASNKIFLGSGGGAGNADNGNGFDPTGGNGGGIVIVKSAFLQSNGNVIRANGAMSPECTLSTYPDCHDAMGGGGGGGTVLINVGQLIDNSIIEKMGGKGADMVDAISVAGRIGPGGGGGGGVLFINRPSLPATVSSINTGGAGGVITQDGNNPYGTTAGASGTNIFNLVLPMTTQLFEPNIDSVRFANSVTTCSAFTFNGTGYTNVTPIISWQWNFGDATTASTQNTSHNYTGTGPYNVTLVGTDINGCKDSATRVISITPLNVNAGNDTAMCSNGSVSASLHGSTSGTTISWTPAALLDNPASQNPTATISNTTTFYLTALSPTGCYARDSVTVTVNPLPLVSTIPDFSICKNDSIQLNTAGNATVFTWTPALSVNNPSTASPYFIDTTAQQLIVTGTIASTGCFRKDTVNAVIKPLPLVRTVPDTSFCGTGSVILNSSGAASYAWSPAANLSNSNIANPLFNGSTPQLYTYIVTGTGTNGCLAKDTVRIRINPLPVVTTIPNINICQADTLRLTSTSNAQSNQWAPATAVNNANTLSPYYIAPGTQTMTLTGTNSSTGCTATASVTVTVRPKPDVRTINDFTSCATNTVTLFTTGAPSYSWSPAAGLSSTTSANPVFTGTGSHTYYVTGTAANGCKDLDTVSVTIADKPVFTAPADRTACTNASVQLDGNNGPNYTYLWTPATNLSNSHISNPVATVATTTSYSLLIRDSICNYDSSFNVLVRVNQRPTVNAVRSNDIECSKPDARLTATGAMFYSWSPATGLSDPTVSNPIAYPAATTMYIVTGTDANNCSHKDSVTVIVKGGRYNGFNIPNAFTPNGDNLNECFGVTDWGPTKNFLLMVYNRFGEKVFETTNSATCWDGYYKGVQADAGNYVFYLRAETLCGNITRKGNVVLVR